METRIPARSSATDTTRWVTILAIAQLTNCGAVIGTLSATYVDAFVAGGTPVAWAARLASAQFFSMALTMLAAPMLLARFDLRLLAGAGVLVGAAGQFLTLQSEALWADALSLAMSGVGIGAIFSVAIAVLSATPSPGKAFGIAAISNQVLTAVLLTLIAWSATRWPDGAAMAITGTFVALNILFLGALPKRLAGPADAGQKASAPRLPGAGYAGVAAMFLIALGFGTVWPVIGQIAMARGIPGETLALLFSIAGVSGILGGVLIVVLAERMGLARQAMIGTIGMALAIVLVPSPALVAALVLVMLFFSFNLPLFLTAQAKIDTSGRLGVLTGSMTPFGISAGQVLAGPLAADQRFGTLTAIAALSVLCSLFLLLRVVKAIEGTRNTGFHPAKTDLA